MTIYNVHETIDSKLSRDLVPANFFFLQARQRFAFIINPASFLVQTHKKLFHVKSTLIFILPDGEDFTLRDTSVLGLSVAIVLSVSELWGPVFFYPFFWPPTEPRFSALTRFLGGGAIFVFFNLGLWICPLW